MNRKTLLITILVSSLIWAVGIKLVKGQERITFNSYIETPEKLVLPLMISLPSDYSETKKYPLTVFLHGNGEFIWGMPNPTAMYKQGITKEIKGRKLGDYQSVIVAIQGQSNNKNWWVEQIDYVIDILTGVKAPKDNHRSDIINTFVPLSGVKKYNLSDTIDFMVISQGGQGFSDWLKRTTRLAGAVSLVSAYVTLNATDPNFNKIKKGVQVYHNSGDAVGKWGSEQLADKAKTNGLDSRKVIYNSTAHDAWTKAFADPLFYEFHKDNFTISVPVKPIEIPKPDPIVKIPSGKLQLKREMFTASNGVNIDAIVSAIIEGKEPNINWQNKTPFTITIDLGAECVVSKLRVKDGQGVTTDPTVLKYDTGQIGLFYGKQYNIWYDMPTYDFKTRYIRIENVQETKKNLPIGLEIIIK